MKARLVENRTSKIDVFEIENDNGMRVELISFGARISRLIVNNKNDELVDVVAGFEEPEGFMGENPYFNALIGRVGNRIGEAKFELNGKQYNLFKNDNGINHLHGGKAGFDKKLWKGEIVDGCKVKFSRLSPDGEEGYPANLQVSVTYSLDDENTLWIDYDAVSDGDTLCSLTNHAYFNLDGTFDTIHNHEVQIYASKVTAYDESLIPHGELKSVDGTPFDFKKAKPLGQDIDKSDKLLEIARGYDINYVFDNVDGVKASAYSSVSGIKMSVYTDRPCMQLYTGNFLDGLQGKKTYGFQSTFCMETQGYPNACNVSEFEPCTLKKGERWQSKTGYKFEVVK